MADLVHIPTVPAVQRVLDRLGSEAFEARARAAAEKVDRVSAVQGLMDTGVSENRAVRDVGVSRNGYRYQRRLMTERQGEPWERLIDLRLPAKRWVVPAEWIGAVQVIRRTDPSASFDRVRDLLESQFGSRARLSNGSIGRALRAAGLPASITGVRSAVTEKAEASVAGESEKSVAAGDSGDDSVVLSGGGGLALLLAAAAESGAVAALARAIEEVAELLPDEPQDVPAEPPGRDERGRLSAEYNRNRLASSSPDEPDPRFRSVEQTRRDKDLHRLTIRTMGREKLEDRLLVFLSAPLLTERRGFDGLDGPSGAYSRVVSQVPYKAATLEKFAGELKMADVDAPLWESYLTHWVKWDRRWSNGEGLRKFVAYLDGSQDPWWTDQFARSGKVARVGRVMPCMSRLLISGGAGVPLWVETFSGQASIKAEVCGMLQRADQILGSGVLGRLLVVDAELVSVELFETLVERANRHFITVLKGSILKTMKFEPEGDTIAFRARDTLREGRVHLQRPKHKKSPSSSKEESAQGKPSTYTVRVVEMVRPDSRHPTPTYFATSSPIDHLGTVEVAETYLDRWPLNERIFRAARNGAGLERSSGFGRESVQNLALVTDKDVAKARCNRAEQAQESARRRQDDLKRDVEKARERLSGLKVKQKTAVYVQAAARKVAEQRDQVDRLVRERDQATKELRRAEKNTRTAADEVARLESMPNSITVRDVTMDSIATCLKLTLLSLLTFITQEYFGLRFEPRTFIEEFVRLPVRLVETKTTVCYQLQENIRSPKRMLELRAACEEINRRGIHHRKRRLVFEVVPPPGAA